MQKFRQPESLILSVFRGGAARGRKAQFICFGRAVAAQAGLLCCQPEPDFGIDLCVRSVADVNQRHRDSGVKVDFQLKSTTRASVTDSAVLYDLEVEPYNVLRDESCPCPRILVVLVVPTDETQWLGQTPEELTLRHCAYCLSLRGFPATTNTRSVRVKIPLTNVFSVESVTALLRRVAERRDP